jgi:hypothetical protein
MTKCKKLEKYLVTWPFEHWKYDDFFALTWWFLLFSLVAPYVIWWKLVDRGRFYEIFSFGLFCGIIANLLDAIGVDLLLWGYPDKLFSMIPPLFPVDICVIPVTSMLIYQSFDNWKSFLGATISWAFVFSFVIEPAFVYFGMFTLHNCKHIYSFFAFIVFLAVCRYIFLKIQKNIKQEGNPIEIACLFMSPTVY